MATGTVYNGTISACMQIDACNIQFGLSLIYKFAANLINGPKA